jgi:hypothetical protein
MLHCLLWELRDVLFLRACLLPLCERREVRMKSNRMAYPDEENSSLNPDSALI